VLSADEVVRFLEAIPSLKSRTALTTVYAAGLGKGPHVMLSPQLLRILRTYWRLARPERWFPAVTAPLAAHISDLLFSRPLPIRSAKEIQVE